MRPALEVAGFVASASLVAVTILSAVRAVVLPRAAQSRIPRVVTRAVRFLFRLRARRATDFAGRDAVMAMLAPVALLALLFSWLAVLVLSYSVMFFCLGGRSVAQSIELSGSSIFTLGTSTDHRFWGALLTYTEAGLGLLLVALFITYFPSIYGAFTRRETGVTLLQVRAGDPPTATTMLIRFHRIEETVDELGQLWRQWETWFADVEESHTTFPVLAYFRSPQPQRSWITAAGALLDGAAFWTACIEHRPDPGAQLCLRAGFLTLRRIADAFGLEYSPDPQADGPISVTRDEWEDAMDEMAAAGIVLLEDREKAWANWKGWRVNYDETLLRLARLVEAPVAPWISDRTPAYASTPRSSASRRWQRGWPRTPR